MQIIEFLDKELKLRILQAIGNNIIEKENNKMINNDQGQHILKHKMNRVLEELYRTRYDIVKDQYGFVTIKLEGENE